MKNFWAWNTYFWGLFFLAVASLSLLMRLMIIATSILYHIPWQQSFWPTLIFGPAGIILYRIGNNKVAAIAALQTKIEGKVS